MHYLYVVLVGFANRPAGVRFGSWQVGVVLGKLTAWEMYFGIYLL